MSEYRRLYAAPCCPLLIDFDPENRPVAVHMAEKAPLHVEALTDAWKEKLDAYFGGELKSFDFPISANGTAFCRKVWQAISEIPYGNVVTYGDIARLTGSAPRAVGAACGKNPLLLLTPCHRVVSRTGLGGFSQGNRSWDLAVKKWLLRHEGVPEVYWRG